MKQKSKNMNIRILGIIPARGGSKGIPNKNIASLGGKPLIYYTIREAKKSKLIDAFIVSTDSPRIARVARSFGADVPFLRPKKFAGDFSRDIEYLQHALRWLRVNRGWKPAITVILQPTCPARSFKDIDNVIRFMRRTNCDSVRTVIDPSPYNPFKMLVMTNTKKMSVERLLPEKYFHHLGTEIPRQLLPKYYLPVGLVYATKSEWINRGRVWGTDVRGFLIDSHKGVDIDMPSDLKRAKRALKELKLL